MNTTPPPQRPTRIDLPAVTSSPRLVIAFTLVELLVVISIITVLLSMLTPALESAFEEARKAVCASNLHAIHMGVYDYGQMSNGQITPPYDFNGKRIQIALDRDSAARLSLVGLTSREKEDRGAMDFNSGFMVPYAGHQASPVWNCPSRNFNSQWEMNVPNHPDDEYHQLVLGYQYMGGIETWYNPRAPGGIESYSPVTIPTSRGSWVLAADTTMKFRGSTTAAWGGGRDTAYFGMPSHKVGGRKVLPSGGNQVHMDGSVTWYKLVDMFWYHSWSNSRPAFFYQADSGGYKYRTGKQYNK